MAVLDILRKRYKSPHLSTPRMAEFLLPPSESVKSGGNGVSSHFTKHSVKVVRDGQNAEPVGRDPPTPHPANQERRK